MTDTTPEYAVAGAKLEVRFAGAVWTIDPGGFDSAEVRHQPNGQDPGARTIRIVRAKDGKTPQLLGTTLEVPIVISIGKVADGSWQADVSLFGNTQRASLASWCKGEARVALKDVPARTFTFGRAIEIDLPRSDVEMDKEFLLAFAPRAGAVALRFPGFAAQSPALVVGPGTGPPDPLQYPEGAAPGALLAAGFDVITDTDAAAQDGRTSKISIGSAGEQSLSLGTDEPAMLLAGTYLLQSRVGTAIRIEGGEASLAVTGPQTAGFRLLLREWLLEVKGGQPLTSPVFRLWLRQKVQTVSSGVFALSVCPAGTEPIILSPVKKALDKRLVLAMTLTELSPPVKPPLRCYVDYRRGPEGTVPDPAFYPRPGDEAEGLPLELHVGNSPGVLQSRANVAVARIGSDSAVKADLGPGRLRLRRAIDGFDLCFTLVGYAVETTAGKARVASLAGAQGNKRLQIVHFWPQHLLEENFDRSQVSRLRRLWSRVRAAFVPEEGSEASPNRRNADVLVPADYAPGARSLLARTRASGPSRAVFDLSVRAAAPIDITPEALTDWLGLPLSVVPRAAPEGLSLDDQIRTVAKIDSSADRAAARDAVKSSFGWTAERPAGTLEPHHTALELVTGLVFSPDPSARVAAPRRPPPQGSKDAEQWSATVSVADGGAARAVWAPDLDLRVVGAADPGDLDEENLRFSTTLSRAQRRQIVMLSSGHGLAALRGLVRDPNGSKTYADRNGSMVALPSGNYNFLSSLAEPGPAQGLPPMRQEGVMSPAPFARFDARLGSFSADIDIEWRGEPPAFYERLPSAPRFFSRAFSVERYTHSTRGGRDAFVSVAEKGYLFPLGLRASLIRIARREAVFAPELGWIYPLVSREFIMTSGREKAFDGPYHPFEARDFHAASLRMITRATPFLDRKSTSAGVLLPKLTGTAFWVRVNQADFGFVYEDPAKAGLRRAPLIFVDNVAAHESDDVRRIVEYYEGLPRDLDAAEGTEAARRTERLFSGEVTLAPSAANGDTTFPASAAILGVRGRRRADNVASTETLYTMDAFMEGADQPPFYPYMERARIRVRALDRLTGAAPRFVDVRHFEAYRDSAFDEKANPAEIYLRVLTPDVGLDLAANGGAAGGVARPEAALAALSRKTGLVGGRLRGGAAKPGLVGAAAEADFDLSAAAAGQFDPSQFFRGATLLGIVPLELVVKAAGIAAAPRIRETLDVALPSGADGQRIAGALRSAADGLSGTIKSADQAIKDRFGEQGVAVSGFAAFYPDLDAALKRFEQQLRAAALEIEAAMTTRSVLAAGSGLVAAWAPLRQALDRFSRDPLPAQLAEALAVLLKAAKDIEKDTVADPLIDIAKLLAEEGRRTLLDPLLTELASSGLVSTVLGPVLAERAGDAIPEPPTDPVQPWPAWTPRLTPEQARAALDELLADPLSFAPQVATGLVGETLGRPFVDLLLALNQLVSASEGYAWPIRQLAEAVLDSVRRSMPLAETRDPIVLAAATKVAAAIAGTLPPNGSSPPRGPAELAKWLEGRWRAAQPGIEAVLDALRPALRVEIERLAPGGKLHQRWTDAERKLRDQLASALTQAERQRLQSLHDQAREICRKVETRHGQLTALARGLADAANRKALLSDLRTAAAKIVEAAIAEQAARIADLKPAWRLFAAVDQCIQFLSAWGVAARRVRAMRADWCETGPVRPYAVSRAVATTLVPRAALIRATLADLDADAAELERSGRATAAGIDAFRSAAAAVRGKVQRLAGEVSAMLAIADAFDGQTLPDGGCAMPGVSLEPLRSLFVHSRAAMTAAVDLAGALGQATAAAPAEAAAVAEAKLQKLRRSALRAALDVAGRPGVGGAWDALFQEVGRATGDKNAVDELLGRYRVALAAAGEVPASLSQQALDAQVELARRAVDGPLKDLAARVFSYGALAGRVAVAADAASQRLAQILIGILRPPAEMASDALEGIQSALTTEGEIGLLAPIVGSAVAKDLAAAAAAAKLDAKKLRDAEQAGSDQIKVLVELGRAWQVSPPGIIAAAGAVQKLLDAVAAGELAKLVDFKAAERLIATAIAELVPAQASVGYAWSASLDAFPAADPVFAMDRDAAPANGRPDLRLEARAQLNLLNPAQRDFRATGELGPFKIHLLGERFDLVTIRFAGATFVADAKSSPSFKADVSGVVIGPMLKFLDALASYMSGGTENGPYVRPSFAPPGIEAGYRFSAESIQLGSLTFLNIALSVSALLPFEARQAEFRFMFASRAKPFLISSPPYGGGGFVALHATAKGIAAFEIQLEFGAVMALRFGPFRGHGRVTAGIYLMAAGAARVLEGFVHAVGEGSVACFSLTLNIEVLIRHNSDGSMNGESTYRVTFRIGWAKFRYSVTARYKIRGGGKAQAFSLLGFAEGDPCAGELGNHSVVICSADRRSAGEWGAYRKQFEGGW